MPARRSPGPRRSVPTKSNGRIGARTSHERRYLIHKEHINSRSWRLRRASFLDAVVIGGSHSFRYRPPAGPTQPQLGRGSRGVHEPDRGKLRAFPGRGRGQTQRSSSTLRGAALRWQAILETWRLRSRQGTSRWFLPPDAARAAPRAPLRPLPLPGASAARALTAGPAAVPSVAATPQPLVRPALRETHTVEAWAAARGIVTARHERRPPSIPGSTGSVLLWITTLALAECWQSYAWATYRSRLAARCPPMQSAVPPAHSEALAEAVPPSSMVTP